MTRDNYQEHILAIKQYVITNLCRRFWIYDNGVMLDFEKPSGLCRIMNISNIGVSIECLSFRSNPLQDHKFQAQKKQAYGVQHLPSIMTPNFFTKDWVRIGGYCSHDLAFAMFNSSSLAVGHGSGIERVKPEVLIDCDQTTSSLLSGGSGLVSGCFGHGIPFFAVMSK